MWDDVEVDDDATPSPLHRHGRRARTSSIVVGEHDDPRRTRRADEDRAACRRAGDRTDRWIDAPLMMCANRIDAYPGVDRVEDARREGRAADRRRVGSTLLPRAAADEPAQVLAVHPGPIDFDALPFVNVAKLLSEMPVPVPAYPRTLRSSSASSRCRISAMSRCRRISARRTRARARRALPAGGRFIETTAAARRRAGVDRLPAVRHRLRRREADVGTAVLHEAFPRSVSRRATQRRPQREALRAEFAAIVEELARRAAGALSSRLPQP